MIKSTHFISAFSKYSNLAIVRNKMYENPYQRLKQYLEIPLLDDDRYFTPNIDTLVEGEKLFIPNPSHRIKFITAGIGKEKFPNHDLPEVIFMGRSNVGKSSLLKAIFNYVPELRIKTSKRAGLTKSAQFYGVGSKLCLVDMPGYGYGQPEWFEDVVHDCLRRRNCVRTFLLIDGKVGFQDSDDIALNALESYRVPYAIVMTKIDKATDARLLRNVLHLRNIKKSPIYCYMQPFFVSSHTFEGLGYLLAYIAHITGNLRIDHSDMNHISN